MGQSLGGSKCEASGCPFPGESWTELVFLAVMCDSKHGTLPTKEAHLSFGVQRFYWGLVT